MRLATPARIRAVGFLLLEVASLGLLVVHRYNNDSELRDAFGNLLKKVKAL